MKQNLSIKTSSMMRNNSLTKKTTTRINSLQKELRQSQGHRQKTLQLDIKQETSAIMQLLEIKDEHDEWKEKHQQKKSRRPTKNRSSKHGKQMNESASKIFSRNTNYDEEFGRQQQQMYNETFLDNIFTKKSTQQSPKLKSYSKTKRSEQKVLHQNHNTNKYKDNNQNNLFMNRTHYWNKVHKVSHQKYDGSSLIQKINKKFYPSQTFYQNHLNNSMRVNSHLEFYRNKSPLQIEHMSQDDLKKMSSCSSVQNNSIKILPNKSITVRQMLGKIKIHSDINIAEPSIQHTKLKQLLQSNNNRQPFDPYTKKTPRQHYKKFTPFKIQEQKRIEYSLQRLEEHLKKNPQIDNKWDELEARYLQKPTYCSWVERNKEKIKRKKVCPLTVRPLKLLN